jgi:hypothetical protein
MRSPLYRTSDEVAFHNQSISQESHTGPEQSIPTDFLRLIVKQLFTKHLHIRLSLISKLLDRHKQYGFILFLCSHLTLQIAMCECINYQSECGHCWFSLIDRCAPNHNLITCPMFAKGSLTCSDTIPPFPQVRAPRHNCPWCHWRGDYDMRYVRVITKEKNGIKFGFGPGKDHPGVESTICCVVM